jgi:hypothetical protein
VVLPAVDSKLLPRRLPEALFEVLKHLGIPWAAIDREMNEMLEPLRMVSPDRSTIAAFAAHASS